jgi:hypothetical protein
MPSAEPSPPSPLIVACPRAERHQHWPWDVPRASLSVDRGREQVRPRQVSELASSLEPADQDSARRPLRRRSKTGEAHLGAAFRARSCLRRHVARLRRFRTGGMLLMVATAEHADDPGGGTDLRWEQLLTRLTGGGRTPRTPRAFYHDATDAQRCRRTKARSGDEKHTYIAEDSSYHGLANLSARGVLARVLQGTRR